MNKFNLLGAIQLVILSFMILLLPMWAFRNWIAPFITHLNFGVLGYALMIIVIGDYLVIDVLILNYLKGTPISKAIKGLELVKINEKPLYIAGGITGMTLIILALVFLSHGASTSLLTELCNTTSKSYNVTACNTLKNFGG